MDGSDADIVFDAQGICNHCHRYDALLSSRVLRGAAGKAALDSIVTRIKAAGKGQDYDCIVGVSGGVDSTYVAYAVKQLGLRPLAVHLDNGWNSELAVKNIERVLSKLNIDLYTHVLDWEEFKQLQIAFLKSSTPDSEIPTDHAIQALLWRQAVKHKVRFIISGMNFTTESICVPSWSYGHSDWRYIKAINARFGKGPRLRTYPHFTFPFLLTINAVKSIRIVSLLNYIDYDKDQTMRVLQEELGWQYYGGKHYESIYTRFFQGYILPTKFGIDKRVGHLSDLINSGQITRDQALEELKKPPYPEALFRTDYEFVLKKLGMTDAEFQEIMRLPIRSYRDYPNSYALVQFMRNTVTRLRGLGLYPR
jgi:N-acetyl sugar amidotransferase